MNFQVLPSPTVERRSLCLQGLSSTACPRGAFSLMEVVLSIGLVMFSALVIFSLMPVGLTSLQDSNREIIETEIIKTVESELMFTSFDKLDSYQSERFPIYFSNEGFEVKEGDRDSVFTVRGSTPVTETGGEAKRLTVSIGYRCDPSQSSSRRAVSRITFLVTDRGN
ncbi:MAG: Verru_Chthon cassette protein B [Chthoniobacteraceae bacterium]